MRSRAYLAAYTLHYSTASLSVINCCNLEDFNSCIVTSSVLRKSQAQSQGDIDHLECIGMGVIKCVKWRMSSVSSAGSPAITCSSRAALWML